MPAISRDLYTSVQALDDIPTPRLKEGLDSTTTKLGLDPDLSDAISIPGQDIERDPKADKGPKKRVEEIVVQKILEALEQGVAPWRRPWSECMDPRNGVSGRLYRGINPFILNVVAQKEGYDDPRWLTYGQIKKSGGCVKEGEFKNAVPIVLWKLWDPKSKEKDLDDGRGEEDSRKSKDESHRLVMRFYKVWNVNQVGGLELKPMPEMRAVNPIERAEAVMQGYLADGPKLQHGGEQAYYSPVRDLVQLPAMRQFENDEAYYLTAFHELVHSTGHESRLNRFAKTTQGGITVLPPFGSQDYSREELVAECGAAMACGKLGIESDIVTDSAAYCQGWLKKLQDDPKCIITAAAHAQKAIDRIFGVSFESEAEKPEE